MTIAATDGIDCSTCSHVQSSISVGDWSTSDFARQRFGPEYPLTLSAYITLSKYVNGLKELSEVWLFLILGLENPPARAVCTYHTRILSVNGHLLAGILGVKNVGIPI
jgi:hypothetical protein